MQCLYEGMQSKVECQIEEICHIMIAEKIK